MIRQQIPYITAKEFNEILRPILLNAAADLAKNYKQFGSHFIKLFLEKEHFRMFCGTVVNEFERILEYQEDEKITEWVDKKELSDRWGRLLKRTLVMIKAICNS